MKESRKLYEMFNIIYVECKQELHEIKKIAETKQTNTIIELRADKSNLNPLLLTKDSHLKLRTHRDPVLAEKLIEKDEDIAMTDSAIKKEMKGMNHMATPEQNANFADFNAILEDNERRAAFGYQSQNASSLVHDICVEDVRDICVEDRELVQTIPCRPNGSAGCRGGFLPDGPPVVESYRVLCADERLSPETGCDRIRNRVEFEIVLRYAADTRVIVTPRDEFDCLWFDFARFPSGDFFSDDEEGLEEFREELAIIDGSCKVIIIEDVRVEVEGNDCVLVVEYRVIDKLWKHENLLILAVRPFDDNITVKQEFGQGHGVGPCNNNNNYNNIG